MANSVAQNFFNDRMIQIQLDPNDVFGSVQSWIDNLEETPSAEFTAELTRKGRRLVYISGSAATAAILEEGGDYLAVIDLENARNFVGDDDEFGHRSRWQGNPAEHCERIRREVERLGPVHLAGKIQPISPWEVAKTTSVIFEEPPRWWHGYQAPRIEVHGHPGLLVALLPVR